MRCLMLKISYGMGPSLTMFPRTRRNLATGAAGTIEDPSDSRGIPGTRDVAERAPCDGGDEHSTSPQRRR